MQFDNYIKRFFQVSIQVGRGPGLQCLFKVSKGAKNRNRYNQVPHLTQDTNEKVINSQLDTTNESQEASPFPAGDHKAHINRRAQRQKKHIKDPQKRPVLKWCDSFYLQSAHQNGMISSIHIFPLHTNKCTTVWYLSLIWTAKSLCVTTHPCSLTAVFQFEASRLKVRDDKCYISAEVILTLLRPTKLFTKQKTLKS